LRKLLGPKAAIRDHRRPSSPEQRDAAAAARRAAKEKRDAALAAVEARKEAILSADAEYQRLRQEFQAARVAHERLPRMPNTASSAAWRRPCSSPSRPRPTTFRISSTRCALEKGDNPG
jgi:hypothetical protein